MKSAVEQVFAFASLIILSAAFLAGGLLIVLRPGTYLQWERRVRWSKMEEYAPWVVRGWDDPIRRGSQLKVFGFAMVLFGVTAAVLTVWIYCFQ